MLNMLHDTPDPLEGRTRAQSPPCLSGHNPPGIAVLEGGVGKCRDTVGSQFYTELSSTARLACFERAKGRTPGLKSTTFVPRGRAARVPSGHSVRFYLRIEFMPRRYPFPGPEVGNAGNGP